MRTNSCGKKFLKRSLLTLGYSFLLGNSVFAQMMSPVSPVQNFGGIPQGGFDITTPFYQQSYMMGSMGFTGRGFTNDGVNCLSVSNNLSTAMAGLGLSGSMPMTSCQQFADDYNIPQAGPTIERANALAKLREAAPLPLGEGGKSQRDSIAGSIMERAKLGQFDGYSPITVDPNIVNNGRFLSGLDTTCRVFLDGDAGSEDEFGPTRDDQEGLSPESLLALTAELGEQPLWRPAGSERKVNLPNPKNDIDLQEKAGYYMYNYGDEITYGTPRTIYNIQAAGKLLAEQGIVMGVGDISKKTGNTPGHSEHKEGQDVDLRLVGKTGPDGKARSARCRVDNSSCYDRENTFKMIKAFIDVDPYGIDKIFINDSALQGMVNTYLRETYSINRVNGSNVSRSCAGHADHVHISFKRHANPTPDEMMEAAR